MTSPVQAIALANQASGRLADIRIIAACAAGLLTLSASPVRAHDAPTGWSYPFACCSGYDCRAVSAKAISEKPEGYVINGTGEMVAMDDTRLRKSPDGDYHWCSVAGLDDSRTICLFVPPNAF